MRRSGRLSQRSALIVAAAALLVQGTTPRARAGEPTVLHEPIPPDPREDLALNVVLDGELPAAIRTPNGVVPAPDPQRLPRPSDASYGAGAEREPDFVPDRETRRPEVSAYDDPFVPSTAPFKRLQAFDAVRTDYRLYVRDARLSPVPTSAAPGADDESFYGDLVVDVGPDHIVRIPTVGPGARIVRARLGIGSTDLPMLIQHDGADNWTLQVFGARGALRARLVMQLVVPRASFGGPFGDPSWTDLPFVPPLPDNVARDAALVRAAIGVSRRQRPNAVIARLVEYFREFAESDDPPRGHRSVYLDLALSKKGVCRHRAFAFLVTAQSLGIPTRMITNEAHAWVEVHDGSLWRRIDLGGAGRLAQAPSEDAADRPIYEPPADPFAWPRDAQRGDDMVAEARSRSSSASGAGSSQGSGSGPGPGANGRSGATSAAAPGGASGPGAAGSASASFDGTPGGDGGTELFSSPPAASSTAEERPAATVTVNVAGAEAHCGQPLRVQGEVRSDGEPCPHVAVELWLKASSPRGTFLLGRLATGDDGAYAGAIVVPADAPRGDYDVVARTPGDARCGAGASD